MRAYRTNYCAQPYICGSAPAYADYIVFSVFQMARLGCPKEVVTKGSALEEWRSRMIALYDGLAIDFPDTQSECQRPFTVCDL